MDRTTPTASMRIEAARIARAKIAYSVRRVDLARPLHLENGPGRAPRHGDLVLAEIVAIGQHPKLELTGSRRAALYPGDEIVVAYGARYAPDQFEAELPEDLDECDLVAAGGCAARVRSRHARMSEATRIRPLGLLAGPEGVLNVADGALPAPPASIVPRARRVPTILVAGTSMNAGKTTTVASMVHGLNRAGLRVGAGKFTGTGAGGDRHSFADAGAAEVLDFTDLGFVSTFRVPVPRLARLAADLHDHLVGRPDLPVHVAAPAGAGPACRLVIVLHGTERNAAEYLDAWAGWAARHDRVVLAPQFDRAAWPGAHGYVLGGVLDAGGARRPRSRWAFTAVTALHRHARARFGLDDPLFDLWGHSAGAQFVHRYLLLAPTAPVRTAIAANAGWYTLPDLDTPYPYGLSHPALRVDAADVAVWTTRPLVLMRGTADVERDEHLRVTPEADAQGPHRYARAATMHRAGHGLGRSCRWRLVDVPGAGHDFLAMAPAAQELLQAVAIGRTGRA